MIGVKVTLGTFLFVLGLVLQLSKAVPQRQLVESNKNESLVLEMVQVIFRHGDRTPRKAELSYLNDDDTSPYQPMGLGQLTNKGKLTEQRLGKALRTRYDQFLGPIYRPNDVYAISTDSDRTKMSLQLVLAGLYPPQKLQMWNDSLNWMPIPTHYLPIRLDTVLRPDLNSLFIKELRVVKQSEKVKTEIEKYKKFFEFLTVKTGQEVNDTIQASDIYHLLTSQKSMGLPWPEWCTETEYKKLIDILKLDYRNRSYNESLRKLNGGTFIKKFLDNVKNSHAKIYLYSAHDVNVVGVVKAHNMEIPMSGIPEYGSAFILEKYRGANYENVVKARYWNGSSYWDPFTLNGCESPCTIENYRNLFDSIIPKEKEVNDLWNNIKLEDLRDMYKY